MEHRLMLVEQEIRADEIESDDGMHCTGIQKGGFFDVAARRPNRCPGKLPDLYQAALDAGNAGQ